MTELEANFNPKINEPKWSKFWNDGGFFKAPVDPTRKPYTILMPPPNVTAQLHMGHGTTYALQDIFVRWRRMQGFNALWLPGTDHAGIATQMMVEKELQEKEGKTKNDLGRPAFEKRLHAWKEKYGGMITQQFRSMGFSCDWDREAYTMDPKLSHAVRAIFVKLFEDGYIYRGERLVNWDCQLKTAISDDEVENKEVAGFLWHIKYPVDGENDTFITIATTRPETMLGDTAVAVNPEDERYKHLIGKKLRLPLVGRLIPVVADDYVKMEFGTGAVKITPAHDPNDFEIGKRHKLPFINIMNEDGTLNQEVPEIFRGKDRFVARKEIIKALKDLGLFEKDQSYKHIIPHSERSKTVIEPRLSLQWYVKMKDLAVPAVEAAKTGKLKFHPDNWKKTYLHWLENIQDWCISRQLWWGHRIPIWYCSDCSEVTTGMQDPTECRKCKSKNIHQDEDVLDTWFSSWLWPISPFGWPEKTKDLDYFYPTNVLVTASEIIFLWVARMVMVGLYTRGEIPFEDVYIAATVCDKQGKKFSKTLGNGIDPLEVIDKYGTDAVRFTGIALAPLGGRVRMDREDFETGGKFVNKLWNAARFLQRYVKTSDKVYDFEVGKLDLASKWLLTEFEDTSTKVNKLMESFRVNEAVESVYQFAWRSYCDWALECAKETLNGTNAEAKAQSVSVLVYVFDGICRLLSPVMPFVTEELWHALPRHPRWGRLDNNAKSLVVAKYPNGEGVRFEKESQSWSYFQNLVTGVRAIRAAIVLPPKEQVEVHVRADAGIDKIFVENEVLLRRLAGVKVFTCGNQISKPKKSLVHVDKGFEAYVPAEGILDVEKEKKRLNSEVDRMTKVLQGINAKLGNADFVARAPEDILVTTRAQKENLDQQVKNLKQNIESLS